MSQANNSFTQLRHQMVTEQLRARGIRNSRVLAAMATVPREEFVPDELRAMAYDDCAKPIGHGQTISQPYTVAYMAEAAQLAGDEKILEIGTGSGYGAAVLSLLGKNVHSIERIPDHAHRARTNLKRLGYSNVHVHIGDGSLGFEQQAPFGAIIVTAGARYLPPAYTDQLAEGGSIIIPIGSRQTSQILYRFRREHDKVSQFDLGVFAFVPLIGVNAWQDA